MVEVNLKYPLVLVTGASGFIGRPLCARLLVSGWRVRSINRSNSPPINGSEHCIISSIDETADWTHALQDVTHIIHLAARVHVMQDSDENPLEAFRRVNVAGTLNLARQAALAGVKRFVFVSSVKVNGEETSSQLFSELDVFNPQDPYGVSKMEAEQKLLVLAEETGLEVVIVRPPLVYGVGVKANFAQMLRVLRRRIPLPLASVRNARSLIYVGNLLDALVLCAKHPKAAGQTYLVSDGEDISTPELLSRLSHAMGFPARLFSFPVRGLDLVAELLGKGDQVRRLTGSLQIDSSKIRRELGWTPPFTLQQGLQETVKHFMNKTP